jgi:Flp pilus assembly protein TadG
MSRLLARTNSETGQALVLVAVAMVALVGMAALVIDGGSWYQAQRHLQTSADAAALAGAQDLPDESSAQAAALDYAGLNDKAAPTPTVTFPSTSVIDVQATATTPGILAPIFGAVFNTVNIHAHAQAQASVPLSLEDVAPIVVNTQNADLSGPGCPCFDQETTIPLGKNGAPGSFALVDLSAFTPVSNGVCSGSTASGNIGSSTLAGWIQNGFGSYLNLGCYDSDSGAKFNASAVQNAMQARIGTTMLFPVYDALTGSGSNAQYNVIGWAAFHLDGFTAQGNSGSITGYFTNFIATGLAPGGPIGGANDFGVHVITLTQ